MGRRSIKTERIKNAKNRLTTWNKRKMGVLKKAMQLSILTGAEISLVMIDHDTGEAFHYSSADHVKNTLENLEGLERPPIPINNASYHEIFDEGKGIEGRVTLTENLRKEKSPVRVENQQAVVESTTPEVYTENKATANAGNFVWNGGMYQMPNGIYYYPMQQFVPQNMQSSLFVSDNFQGWGNSNGNFQQTQQEMGHVAVQTNPGVIPETTGSHQDSVPEEDLSRKRKRDEDQTEKIVEKKRRTDEERSLKTGDNEGEDLDLRIKIPNNTPSYFMMPLSPNFSSGTTPRSLGNFSPNLSGLTPMSPTEGFPMYYMGSGLTPTGFTPTGFTPNSLFSPLPFFYGNSQKDKN